MARTSRRTLDALVGFINKACGYPPNAGQWEPHRQACARGYAIYANSPGDGVTRYQLHFYPGKGSASDCSWSYSLGAAVFEGKLRAFLAGLDREAWGEGAHHVEHFCGTCGANLTALAAEFCSDHPRAVVDSVLIRG